MTKNLSIVFILNIFTQVSVGLIAIYSLPIIFNTLGAHDFGLYSSINIIFSTAILLDFGIGKATVYSISNNLENKLTVIHIIKYSFILTVIISTVLCLSIYFIIYFGNFTLTNTLKYRELHYIYIASIPIVLFIGIIKNILEGLNKLIHSTIYRYILNLSTYIIPLIFCRYNHDIINILSAILHFRLLFVLGAFLYLINITLKYNYTANLKSNFKLKGFLIFAGWSSITNLLTPLLMQLDKLLIITFLSFTALSFYTLPMEIINGFLIVPAAMASITLPGFCSSSITFQEKIKTLFDFTRYLFLFLFPIVCLSSICSRDILFLWQGVELSTNSSIVFSILLIASIVLSFGWLISNLLIGIGRVDIPSKVFLFEIPIYTASSIALIYLKGINGLAFAVLIRALIEYSGYSYYLIKISKVKFSAINILPYLYFILTVLIIFILISTLKTTEIRIAAYLTFLLLVYAFEYFRFTTATEKDFLKIKNN